MHPINGELKRVVDHSRQKHFEKLRTLLQARVGVCLDQPSVEITVQNEVVAKQLEEGSIPLGGHEFGLYSLQGDLDLVLHLLKDLSLEVLLVFAVGCDQVA